MQVPKYINDRIITFQNVLLRITTNFKATIKIFIAIIFHIFMLSTQPFRSENYSFSVSKILSSHPLWKNYLCSAFWWLMAKGSTLMLNLSLASLLLCMHSLWQRFVYYFVDSKVSCGILRIIKASRRISWTCRSLTPFRRLKRFAEMWAKCLRRWVME